MFKSHLQLPVSAHCADKKKEKEKSLVRQPPVAHARPRWRPRHTAQTPPVGAAVELSPIQPAASLPPPPPTSCEKKRQVQRALAASQAAPHGRCPSTSPHHPPPARSVTAPTRDSHTTAASPLYPPLPSLTTPTHTRSSPPTSPCARCTTVDSPPPAVAAVVGSSAAGVVPSIVAPSLPRPHHRPLRCRQASRACGRGPLPLTRERVAERARPGHDGTAVGKVGTGGGVRGRQGW